MTQTTNAPATANGSTQVATAPSVKSLLAQKAFAKRFEDIMGEKAAGFISSVINVVNSNGQLAKADPQSVIMCAVVAATLDLPINPNLGFAYIIPYSGVAQFQIGYKGFIQLAMRTGQYKKINAIPIRGGQLVKVDPLMEHYEFDFSKENGEIVGYAAYFQLINGFEKTVYWNVQKIIDHAKRYSKSYGKASSPWTTNFDEMALKTLIKWILSKFGILSIDMQTATSADQAVVQQGTGGEEFIYVDHVDLTGQQAISQETSTTDQQQHTGDADQSADHHQGDENTFSMPKASEL